MWYRLLPMGRISMGSDTAALKKRFLRFVDSTSSPKGCWLWTGFKDKDGYGYFKIRVDGKAEQRAHRVAHILWKGPIPANKMLLHVRDCSNKSCCSPEHTYIGTALQNSADAIAVGRILRGEASG